MRDFSEELVDLARRVRDAEKYLRIADARRRLVELERSASDSALWDDPDEARRVTTELSRLRGDVELVDTLDQRVSDAETLFELAREEGDDSGEQEIGELIGKVAQELDGLELRALFSGEHDERDAICEIHSGAGGTDAQDWAEMLL